MESPIPDRVADQLFAADALTVARLIKRYSLRRGWRMEELALRSGVSRTTLYQLLRGAIRKPRHSTLHKIAAALQIPLSYLQPDRKTETHSEEPDYSVSDQLQHKRKIDRAANAVIDVVEAEHPEYFTDWQEQDWDELYSTFGVGGSLTYAGVIDRARQINRNRETLKQLQLVLETHLSGLAEGVVHALYQLIAIEADNHTVPPDDVSNRLTTVLNDLLEEMQTDTAASQCQGKNW